MKKYEDSRRANLYLYDNRSWQFGINTCYGIEATIFSKMEL